MSYEAARIIKKISAKGAKSVGFQGVRIGTVESISPLSLKIDNINFKVGTESLLVNEQLVSRKVVADISASSASVGDKSGAFSAMKANMSLPLQLKSGDRVAVSQIDMKLWVILCKVVSM